MTVKRIPSRIYLYVLIERMVLHSLSRRGVLGSS